MPLLISAAEWNEKATSKLLPFREVAAAFERDEIHEVFGTGTAAVIQPIGFIKYREKTYEVPKSCSNRSLQLRLTNELHGIQVSREDPLPSGPSVAGSDERRTDGGEHDRNAKRRQPCERDETRPERRACG